MKDPNKFNDYLPAIKTIASSMPTHDCIIDAIVSCCTISKKDAILVSLLNACIDPKYVNKKAAEQLFIACSNVDFFSLQIKASRYIQDFSHDIKYKLACMMCGYLNQKYSPEFADIPIQTSIPVVYPIKNLQQIVYDSPNPPISAINLMCHIFTSVKLYQGLLRFLSSEQSKTTLISSFTKAETRLECYLHLNADDALIDFCKHILNKNNVFFLEEYLVKLYKKLLQQQTEETNKAKIKLIEEIANSPLPYDSDSYEYYQIKLELAKYEIFKTNQLELFQKIYQYCYKNTNNMLVLNLSPHVKSLGRELLHYFDSKKNSSPNSKVLSISSSITFFKTILGTYNELDFVNKKNIAIKKLEDILKTPDVMAKCRLMFCVIELLFSMTEGINMTSHFDLYFLIICLIKSFFSQTCCSQMGLVQLFCFKQLGLHDLDKISNVCSFDVKNILLETLPIQFESKLVVGEYISAVKQAQDLIAFNESAIYSIKTQILKAFNYGSWHSIEQMIEAKYQFMMSYKAILAKRTLQYYNIFINTSHATVRKTNFSLHRAEDIIFASIYSLNNMPIFYIHQDKYTLKDFSLPYLVDNSDDFLLNQCQSPMRKYTSEVEDICNKHKLFIIKLKTILIKNSKELVNMLEKALTKSDLTKYMIQRTNEFQQLSLEYDCIPQLPYNYDFIFVDIPMQASLWKKYGFISLLAEFYNEIISIQEDETDSLYSMEFIASCNQLQHLSNKVTQTNSLEGYLEIFYASTILFEIFSIITHECNTLKLFNFSSIFEPNHFNKYLFEKIKYIHSSLLSITQCLMFCIPHIEKQETTISIKEKYLDFLLDFIDPIHFGNVIKELKNQYSEHIKNIIRNFSISLNATKIR